MVNLKMTLCWYNTHPFPKIYVHTSFRIRRSKMLRNIIKTKFDTRTDGQDANLDFLLQTGIPVGFPLSHTDIF